MRDDHDRDGETRDEVVFKIVSRHGPRDAEEREGVVDGAWEVGANDGAQAVGVLLVVAPGLVRHLGRGVGAVRGVPVSGHWSAVEEEAVVAMNEVKRGTDWVRVR